MTDGLLIVIAVATVVVAVIQVGIVVFAIRAARQVGETVRRFEKDLQPVLANLQSASTDIARTAAMAASQAQRAERAFSAFTERVDSVASTLLSHVVTPFGKWAAVIEGLRTAFDVFQRYRRRPRRPPERAETRPDGDDEMFIG